MMIFLTIIAANLNNIIKYKETMMVGEFNDNRVTTAKHSTHPMNSSYPSSAGGNRILTTTQPMYP